MSSAREAADYRMLTFLSPWPEEFAEDEWELFRVMSTDEPHGDGEKEEEFWDEARMAEDDELPDSVAPPSCAPWPSTCRRAALVAMTEILVCEDEPQQSWQLITVVHPEHRGHRLGLAVKLANLEFLSRHSPGIRFVVTGNAAVNAPMIAVNDMMGFRIPGEGIFWQKHLEPV